MLSDYSQDSSENITDFSLLYKDKINELLKKKTDTGFNNDDDALNDNGVIKNSDDEGFDDVINEYFSSIRKYFGDKKSLNNEEAIICLQKAGYALTLRDMDNIRKKNSYNLKELQNLSQEIERDDTLEDLVRSLNYFDKENSFLLKRGQIVTILSLLGDGMPREDVEKALDKLNLKDSTIDYCTLVEKILAESSEAKTQ